MAAKESRQAAWPQPAWRWLIWLVYVIAWSTALLTTQPVHIATAVLPESARFPTAKLLHVGAYLVLTALSGWVCARSRWRWFALLFVSFHAMATEYLQQFVPERSGSVRDVLLDHIGILLGLVLTWHWWRKTDRSSDAAGESTAR